MKTFLILSSRGCAGGLLALALAGCHHHDDGHAHEEKTGQITAWSERFEVFAEYKAVTAGKPARLVTHVTDWLTGEARTNGMVKFELRQKDGTMAEHSQPAPARPGIYLPSITFPKQGQWEVTLLIPLDGTNSTVELGTVIAFADEHSAQHANFPEPPEGISFLKEQQWKLPTRIEPVGKRRLVERIRAPAQVAARPGSLAHISPPMAGKLQPPPGAKFPLPGDRVEAGQTLALLQPAFSEATAKLGETEGDIARARFAVAQAKRDHERARGLFESGIESQQNLELAKLAFDSAEAQLVALLATQTSYQQGSRSTAGLPAVELKSPISGVIISTESIAHGQHMSAERVVFTILDASVVFIEARVPVSEAGRMGGAMNALVQFPGREGEFQPLTGEGRGRLVFASPQVDAATHTVALHYEASNAGERFRVGEPLTVLIECNRAENALAIPDSAIVEEGGQPVAFVQVSGETFEKRELTLGRRDGAFVQVLRGLTEGERVVSKGAMAIRLASMSNIIPAHGHAH